MENGIKAGDPLIDEIIQIADARECKTRITKASGAKKGDGDIHLMNKIMLDGKYTYTPPKHPKFSLDDLKKVNQQAENHMKYGAIVTNVQDGNYICFRLETFIDMIMDLQNNDNN